MKESDKLPISVVIMTKNEAERIADCIESASFSQETVVVDSGSDDGTVEIARSLGARVVERDWPGDFSNQRTFAEKEASQEWVLQLDADERVSPELARELTDFFQSGLHEKFDAGRFPRKEIIFGKWVKHGGWYPQYKLRLYRKGSGRWVGVVHEKYVTDKPTHTFENPLIHESYTDVHTFIDKFNRYSSIDAEQDFEMGRRFSLWRLFFRPLERFFGRYVVQKGYKDGMHGLVLALLIALNYFIRELKLWEKSEGERRIDR